MTSSSPSHTIIRGRRDADNPYFVSPRHAPQDASLSFEARGILWYLLSKPDDWIVRVEDLQRQGDIGRDKVQRILKELVDARYLIPPQRYRTSGGQWDYTPYQVFETPQPSTENPLTVEPLTENPAIYRIKNTELERTEEVSRKGRDLKAVPLTNQPANPIQSPSQTENAKTALSHPFVVAWLAGTPKDKQTQPIDASFWESIHSLETQGATAADITALVASKFADAARPRTSYLFKFLVDDLPIERLKGQYAQPSAPATIPFEQRQGIWHQPILEDEPAPNYTLEERRRIIAESKAQFRQIYHQQAGA